MTDSPRRRGIQSKLRAVRRAAILLSASLTLGGCSFLGGIAGAAVRHSGSDVPDLYVAHGPDAGQTRRVNLPEGRNARYAYFNPNPESIIPFCGHLHLVAIDGRRDEDHLGINRYVQAEEVEVASGPHKLVFKFSGWCATRTFAFELFAEEAHYYVPVVDKEGGQVWAWIEDRTGGGEAGPVAAGERPPP